MKLLDLPPEVIDGHILPFLQWNDLLRFRRVCKVAKSIIHGFLNVHPELAPEIEINEEDKSFGAFLEMGIPTTKIFLRNVSGDEFYEKEEADIATFLEECGGIITSLRVDALSLHLFRKELKFIETLVNLQSLEVGHIFYGVPSGLASDRHLTEEEYLGQFGTYLTRIQQDPRYELEDVDVSIPTPLRKLKVLKIGQEECTWRRLQNKIDMQRGVGLIHGSVASLEYISLPFTSHAEPMDDSVPEDMRDPGLSLCVAMNAMIQHEEEYRQLQNIPPRTSVRIFDFANFHDPGIALNVHFNGCNRFHALCALCVENGTKLRNVSPYWLMALVYCPTLNLHPETLGKPIMSLVGLHPIVVGMELPNLERIEIKATSTSSAGLWRGGRQEWRNLKEVDITVDSKICCYIFYEVVDGSFTPSKASSDADTLFQFFFEDIVRPEMTELRFNFVKDADSVAIPKAMEIVTSCPNLKKLILINWPGSNTELSELFGGLPGLEEVSLEHCKTLGDDAFVGTDAESPVFSNPNKLKKLTLKGLDHMPNITNLLFTMVISTLKLTHLTLTCHFPIKSITAHGILSMLEGSFAETIEKFPFQDFSLDGVSTEELVELEKQFRSYDMI